MKFTIIPVAPIRTDRVFAHVNRGARGSGFEWIDSPVYPPYERGMALRELRVKGRVGLSEAARLLDMAPVDLSGIEHGRATFADDATWVAVEEQLRRAAKVYAAAPAYAPEGTDGVE